MAKHAAQAVRLFRIFMRLFYRVLAQSANGVFPPAQTYSPALSTELGRGGPKPITVSPSFGWYGIFGE